MKKKLIEVQKLLKAPKNQRNDFGKYNYRSAEDIIEAVKPLLHERDLLLVLSDKMVSIGTRVYVEATATVYDLEDHFLSATAFARESEKRTGMDDSQLTGSTSSYARKYALNGLFGIDDTKDADTNEQHRQVNTPPKHVSTPVKKASTPPKQSAEDEAQEEINNAAILESIEEIKTEAGLLEIWDTLDTTHRSMFKKAIQDRKKAINEK